MVRFITSSKGVVSVKLRAVVAAQSIANIVKSSLGPLGLDKMLVDNIGVRHDALRICFDPHASYNC